MCKKFKFKEFCILISIIASISINVCYGQVNGEIKRWDLRMIEEGPIWHRLLTAYEFADINRYWPETKQDLETIINDYPESQWVDDAALALAIGQATVEEDIPGAIPGLKEIMEQYPDEHTIIDCECSRRYRIDEDWRIIVRNLVWINPDHEVIRTFPFEITGPGLVNYQHLGYLKYFEHLERYPRLTKDTAQVIIMQLLHRMGDLEGEIIEFNDLISRHPDIAESVNADKAAAAEPYSYYIGLKPFGYYPIFRPLHYAYHWMMQIYYSNGM